MLVAQLQLEKERKLRHTAETTLKMERDLSAYGMCCACCVDMPFSRCSLHLALFVASVCHEIRNPINAMQKCVQLVLLDMEKLEPGVRSGQQQEGQEGQEGALARAREAGARAALAELRATWLPMCRYGCGSCHAAGSNPQSTDALTF